MSRRHCRIDLTYVSSERCHEIHSVICAEIYEWRKIVETGRSLEIRQQAAEAVKQLTEEMKRIERFLDK